jgi:hypothetical protein
MGLMSILVRQKEDGANLPHKEVLVDAKAARQESFQLRSGLALQAVRTD